MALTQVTVYECDGCGKILTEEQVQAADDTYFGTVGPSEWFACCQRCIKRAVITARG